MRRATILLVLIACACSRAPTTTPTKTFELRGVTAGEIAKLEAELPKAPRSAEPIPDLEERVRGFTLDRAHAHGKLRRQSLEEVAAFGDAAVPILDALLNDKGRAQAEAISVVEVLGAIDTPSSADALAKRVDIERVRNPAIRAQAAFQLLNLSADHVLPHLLSQLKYESDGETVVWIAAVLAKHRNYSGMEGLRVLASSSPSDEVRGRAAALLAQCASEAGFADGEALHEAWWSADPERKVPREEPSPRLRLETWKRIAALSAFDLRLVDDARFALSRSAWWVVELLAAALHEKDAHTRVHVAQSLERMGGRASGACAELILALDEPRAAPAAANALGEIRCADAADALVARTRPTSDPELRHAAVVALGKLGARTAIPALTGLLAGEEPPDLRQAAAESLVVLGEDQAAIGVLVECLTRPGADASSAESALEKWIRGRDSRGGKPGSDVLERWRELGEQAKSAPTPEAIRSRQHARAALLRDAVPSAAPPGR